MIANLKHKMKRKQSLSDGIYLTGAHLVMNSNHVEFLLSFYNLPANLLLLFVLLR